MAFQQDNATTHATRLTLNSLTAFGIFPRQANSPDLNLIENLWNIIGRDMNRRLLAQIVDYLRTIVDLPWVRFYLAQWRKKTSKTISLETKIASLDRLEKGEGSTAIGKHFNLGESTVRAIKKNEAAIRKSVISGTKLSTKFASYTRDVLLERTERAIAIWIKEQVQRRIPVSGYLIQEKALQFYKSMKQSEPSTSTSQAGKEFSASKGWLTGFLKRNALHNIKITDVTFERITVAYSWLI
ncbi:tigger transposable element-derived protein 1 [Trichonephila clavipes]|uniref:Tigger transposable element-derived protein 1 n=1 Tax=Trichonephila clavipes TaxID=2585209 RepID=A0A8X6RDM7_TRICX|nr:tigger transposable element-derived protein 1 [Trichonephila clavipes]